MLKSTSLLLFLGSADENNCPIIFHCAGGRDRTGEFAYILGALLGASKRELLIDYEITYFTGYSYVECDDAGIKMFREFYQDFDKLEGKTLQAKAETYCRNIGLTDEKKTKIQTIMLENRR